MSKEIILDIRNRPVSAVTGEPLIIAALARSLHSFMLITFWPGSMYALTCLSTGLSMGS